VDELVAYVMNLCSVKDTKNFTRSAVISNTLEILKECDLHKFSFQQQWSILELCVMNTDIFELPNRERQDLIKLVIAKLPGFQASPEKDGLRDRNFYELKNYAQRLAPFYEGHRPAFIKNFFTEFININTAELDKLTDLRTFNRICEAV